MLLFDARATLRFFFIQGYTHDDNTAYNYGTTATPTTQTSSSLSSSSSSSSLSSSLFRYPEPLGYVSPISPLGFVIALRPQTPANQLMEE
jgi:hypothetical protein